MLFPDFYALDVLQQCLRAGFGKRGVIDLVRQFYHLDIRAQVGLDVLEQSPVRLGVVKALPRGA